MTILLRNNTKQVRDELKRIGYKMCACCTMRHSPWIFCSDSKDAYRNVHSVPKEKIGLMLAEGRFTDCKTDKKKFLNLAKKMMR